MAPTCTSSSGRFTRAFRLPAYHALCRELQVLRIDPQMFEARKDVLSFVVGLRFSSLLIYQIRSMLEDTPLTASWGVIVEEDENTISGECDIIVHADKWLHRWDGAGSQSPGPSVMDFRFVPRKHVRLAISCKSEVSSLTKKLREEAVGLQGAVDTLWLFAECCKAKKPAALAAKASKAGYQRFWYLYTLDKDNIPQHDEPQWMSFADQLRGLAEQG